MDIYVSPKVQCALIGTQRCIFGITSALNVLSLYCLLTKMPPNQAGVRNYLIAIQIVIIITSVFLDVLYEPIPLAPAKAIYCVGLLCAAGVRPHTMHGLFVYLICVLGLVTIACVFYRHQSIVPPGNRLRISTRLRWIGQVLLAVIVTVVCMYYPLSTFEYDDHERILTHTSYNLRWALARGTLLVHEDSAIITCFIALVEMNLVFVTLLMFLPFWHMRHVLSKQTVRLPSTVQRIHRSLNVLFIQIAVPLLFIIVPAAIFFTSLLCDCIPFVVTLPSFYILSLHPLVHNVILLSVTPSFRRFLQKTIKGQDRRRSSAVSTLKPKMIGLGK